MRKVTFLLATLLIVAGNSFAQSFSLNSSNETINRGVKEEVFELRESEIQEFHTNVASNQKLLSQPDLTLVATGFVDEYYAVPFTQVSATVGAIVTNIGAELTDATNVSVVSGSTYVDEKALTIPMAPQVQEEIEFNSFTDTTLGLKTFVFSADASNDADSNNKNDTARIEVHETDLVRDNGDILSSMAIGSPGDYLGNVFTVNLKDTLNEVTFYLSNPTSGNEVSVTIFTMTETGPGTEIASSETITVNDAGEYTVAFSGDGVVLDEGNYFIGVKEGVNMLTLAVTSTPFIDGTAWMSWGGTWFDLGAQGYKHTYYLRLKFGVKQPVTDVALTRLNIPTIAKPNTDVDIAGTIFNNGTTEITSLNVRWSDGINENVENLNNLNIAPSASYDFLLDTKFSKAELGDYLLKVNVENPNGITDNNTTNDTLLHNITITNETPPIFKEDFEFGHLNMWTLYDEDNDLKNWEAINITENAHGGDYYAASASYDNGPLTPENWLVSPAINLSGLTESVILEYFIGPENASYQAEKYKCLISTNGNTIADFTTTLYEEIVIVGDDNGYLQRTIDITAYKDSVIYLAWVHFDCTNQERLKLDDITIFEKANVPDLTIKASGHVNEYYAVPADQAKISIAAKVTNLGWELTEATNASVTMGNTYSDESPITVPMANQAEQVISFMEFNDNSLGNKTFIFCANASNDADSLNGTDTATIEIHETDLIRDNGVISGSMVLSYPGGFVGNLFTVNAKDTLTSVIFYLNNPTDGDMICVDVFEMTESGPGEKVGGSADLMVEGGDREYEAKISGVGLILEPGQYIFAVKEGDHMLSLAATSTEYIPGTAWALMDGVWYDLGPIGYNHTYYLRPRFGSVNSGTDISIGELNIPYAGLVNEQIEIAGTIKNEGTNTINSFDIKWTDGTNEYTETLSDLNIQPAVTYNFVHGSTFSSENTGEYTITVTIENPNGESDPTPENNSISKEIIITTEIIAKKQLFEHFTSSTCDPCSEYTPTADELQANNEGNYSLIRYQVDWPGSGDPYYIPATGTRVEYYNPNGVPSVYRNGAYNMDVSQSGFDAYASQISNYALEAKAHYEENNVVVEVAIRTIGDINENLVAHIAIVENETFGNIGGNGEGKFRNVLMAMLPDATGTSLSTLTPESPVTISETVDMSTTFVEEMNDLSVIVFVQDNITKEVLQSEMMSIGTVDLKSETFEKVKIAPNPFNNTLIISNLENSQQIVISNILGQTERTIHKFGNELILSTEDLENGIYLITIIDKNNNSKTERVVKQ